MNVIVEDNQTTIIMPTKAAEALVALLGSTIDTTDGEWMDFLYNRMVDAGIPDEKFVVGSKVLDLGLGESETRAVLSEA